MTQPLFIVGARGSGKSTIGQALAQVLGYTFADINDILWQVTGKTEAEIVAKEGWVGFRARESDILTSVTRRHTVIATGSGIVLSADNRRFMRAHGTVVYLYAPALELFRRLQAYPKEGKCPSLTGKPMIEEITEVLVAREKLYQEAAHHILDASQTPDDLVCSILQQLYPNTAN